VTECRDRCLPSCALITEFSHSEGKLYLANALVFAADLMPKARGWTTKFRLHIPKTLCPTTDFLQHTTTSCFILVFHPFPREQGEYRFQARCRVCNLP
jgi:hypothetical protein